MQLNKDYYIQLLKKYDLINTISIDSEKRFPLLSLQMILNQCRNKKDMHINFQSEESLMNIIAKDLFVQLSNEIFCNAADFPQLNIGDKVKSKKEIHVGKPKPLFLTFTIHSIVNKRYILKNDRFSITLEKPFSELVEKFIPISQNAQNDTLAKFILFFDKLNKKPIHDFNPTFFERKSVFIGPKSFYDSLEVKNKIPITYYPNPREGAAINSIKSIPALPDNIMYQVSKYRICYDQILTKGKKINNVIILNSDLHEVEQIINDRDRFGFNIIVLTNSFEPLKFSNIPSWDWFNEEIDLINSL
jgi:hypothetical protein